MANAKVFSRPREKQTDRGKKLCALNLSIRGHKKFDDYLPLLYGFPAINYLCNSLPNDKISDLSKLKAFAEDNIKFVICF